MGARFAQCAAARGIGSFSTPRALDVGASDPSIGILVRLFYVSGRDAELDASR
jgi:hypothetical protein